MKRFVLLIALLTVVIGLSAKDGIMAPVSGFAWGADIGSSIDMTGQDMTAIDIDANFGYKNGFIKFIGIGAGIKMMVSNSSRCYPVYGLFRSSFSTLPKECFMEVKAGISFNNLYTDIYQKNFVGGLGVGFVLASGRTFSSHITLGYEFMPMDGVKTDAMVSRLSDLHYATIKIGASF